MEINVQSKAFWESYIRTAEARAGHALGRTKNEAAYQNARINDAYCPIILNYTDKSWNWDWSTHNTTILSSQPAPRKTEEEEEEDRNNTAKIVGVSAILAGAGFFAYFAKKALRASDTLSITQQILSKTETELTGDVQRRLASFVTLQNEIDQINYSKVRDYAISAFALLSGGILLASGGFAAAPILITSGQILSIASVALGVMALAWHWSDDSDTEEKYKQILNSESDFYFTAKSSLALLEELNESMERPPAYSPPQYPPQYEYVPLFMEPSAPPAEEVFR